MHKTYELKKKKKKGREGKGGSEEEKTVERTWTKSFRVAMARSG